MSNKLKIFLSGGMSNIPEEDSKKWRRLFKQVKYKNISSAYYADQYIFINPTTLYKPSEPYDPIVEKEAMEYDLYWVKHSDLIVVNFNSLSSIGTAQEIMLAYTLNKPIIGMIEIYGGLKMIKKYKNNWKRSSKIKNRKYKIRAPKKDEIRKTDKIPKNYIYIGIDSNDKEED